MDPTHAYTANVLITFGYYLGNCGTDPIDGTRIAIPEQQWSQANDPRS